MKPGRVATFVALTFAISWGFDLVIVAAGDGTRPWLDLGMTPWGMFVPAAVALLLQLLVFSDSPIYFRTYREKPRWILLSFLVLTVVYGFITVLATTVPGAGRILAGLGALAITLWTLAVFFIAGRCDAESLKKAGLGLDRVELGQLFVAGVVAFVLVQAGLNLLFGLGELRPPADRIYGVPVPGPLYPFALIVFFVAVAVIGLPLSGLAAVFGEEYGWRGFLQGELTRTGRARGVFLVGVVWGVWHFPVILGGIHTYPPSAFGLLLGVAFFVLWGFVQSYALLKTGSIWVAAFMHGVVNSAYSFTITYGVRPTDKVFSFGLGLYGMACLAVIVALVLRDPIWRPAQRAD